MVEKFPEYKNRVTFDDAGKPQPPAGGTPSASSATKFRLPDNQDFAEMQRRGIVPPSSETKVRRVTPVKYDLEANTAQKVKPVVKKPATLAQAEAQASSLYNFKPEDKDALKADIDAEMEDRDLNLEHPYQYYSTNNPQKSEANSLEVPDTFVAKEYGDDALTDMGINPVDFDGFLNKKGYKKDFLDKESRGLFEGTGRSLDGYDIQLAKEIQKKKLLDLYIREMNTRNFERKSLLQEKDNIERSGADAKHVSPENIFNTEKVGKYIEKTMPILTQKLKERDAESAKILKGYNTGENGAWFLGKETLKSGWNGMVDRINNTAATIYDTLGFRDTAEGSRLMHEENQLLKPDVREVAYASGKKVKQGGVEYLVGDDGQIYDVEKKIRVTDLMEKSVYDKIMEKAKTGEDSWMFSSRGAAIQTGGIIGDMAVQLAATHGVGVAAKAAGETYSVLRPTSQLLSKIPMSRDMGAAIVAQTGLGYSQGLEDTLKAARDAGIPDSQAYQLANDAAQRMAVLYAITAPISPQTKATEALFGNGTKKLIKEAISAYASEGKQGFLNIIKNGVKELAERGAEFTEEGAKELFQENVQQLGEIEGVNAQTNADAGRRIVNDKYTAQDVVNTSILSFITGGLATQMKMPSLKVSPADQLKSLQTLANDSEGFSTALKNMVDNGSVSKDIAERLKEDVRVFNQNAAKLPKSISSAAAMPVMKKLDQIKDLEVEKSITDKAFHEAIDAKIEAKRGEIRSIISTKPDEQTTQPESHSAAQESQAGDDSGETPQTVQTKEVNLKQELRRINAPQSLINAISDDHTLSYPTVITNSKNVIKGIFNLAGLYNSSDKTIQISKLHNLVSKGRDRVLLHEAVHAGTVLTFNDVLENPGKYNQEQVKAVKDLNDIAFDYRVSTTGAAKFVSSTMYGTTNTYEFMSEFVSNPKFREHVGKVNQDKDFSLVDHIWTKILQMFGVDRRKIDTDKIQKVSKLIEDIFDISSEKNGEYVYPKVTNPKVEIRDNVSDSGHNRIEIVSTNDKGQNLGSTTVLKDKETSRFTVIDFGVSHKENTSVVREKLFDSMSDESRKRGIEIYSDPLGLPQEEITQWERLVTKGLAVKIGEVKGDPEYTSKEYVPLYKTLLNQNEQNTATPRSTQASQDGLQNPSGAESGTDRSIDGDVPSGSTEVDPEVLPQVEDFHKIDLKDSLGIDKANEVLAAWDKALKDFGDETLGVGIPVVLARGAVKVMQGAVKTAGTTADIISAGLNHIRESEWYKTLKPEQQKEIDAKYFMKQINKALSATKQTTKSAVRTTTGQTDTSPVVVSTERKLLREKFQVAAKASKEGYKFGKDEQLNKDTLKKMKADLANLVKAGKLTTNKANQLVNAAVALDVSNEKAVEKFYDRFGKAMVVAQMGEVLATLKRDVKRVKAKIRTTFNTRGDIPAKLARLKLDNLPEDAVADYAAVMHELAGNDYHTIDWDKVEKTFEDLKVDYDRQIEHEYQEKKLDATLKEQMGEKDASEEENILEMVRHRFDYDTEAFSDYENNIIHKFLAIPESFLFENFDKAGLVRLIKSLMSVQNGMLPNKVLNDAVNKYTAVTTADNIQANASENITYLNGWVDTIHRAFQGRKNTTTEDFTKALMNKMLQHVDTVVKGLKGTILYDNIIHPVTSLINKAEVETEHVYKEYTHLLAKAKESRQGSRLQRLIPSVIQGLNLSGKEGYEFTFEVERQLFHREMEFRGNPEYRGKTVHAVKDHMDALRASNDNSLTEAEKASVLKVYDKYAAQDGSIDIEKLNRSWTAAEKAVVDFERKNIDALESRSREVNDHVKGESLVYNRDYFPRRNDGDSYLDNIDVAKNIILGSTSVKATASNARTNVVRPLDFRTAAAFMQHIREGNIQYNLSNTMKVVGQTLNMVAKSDNKGLVTLSQALHNTINTLIKAKFNDSHFVAKSKRAEVWKAIVRNTFTKLLASTQRMVIDSSIQWGTVGLFNAHRIGEVKRAYKALPSAFINEHLFKDFGSTQMERLAGGHSVDYATGITSTISKAKFQKFNPTFIDNAVDLFKKNKITDFSREFSQFQYKLSDSVLASLIWRADFVKNYKAATGKDFDPKAYQDNPAYKIDNANGIQEAISKADKAASRLFNTGTSVEQKVAVQASHQWWKKSVDSFMQSFNFNENSVFWDSLRSMFGRGTIDNKADALRTFLAINTRGVAYSYMMQMAVTYSMALLGYDDDDDEKEAKAFKRAVASQGMLAMMGNSGALWNAGAALLIEGLRAKIAEENGEDYDKYEDGVLMTPDSRKLLGSLGADGAALQTLYEGTVGQEDILTKIYHGEEITEDDIIKYKTIKTSFALASQLTGLPIDRMGRVQQKIYEAKAEE